MSQIVGHFIQRDILRNLSRATSLNFSKLKPQGIDNGVFNYHLRALITRGLIVNNGGEYTLSSEGVKYVSSVTRTNLDLHPQPKIFCLLVIENEKGEYVMHRRAAQPFLGQYTFPGGALFFDETLDELVTRQLYEKIGSHVKMTHRGMASLRLGEKGYTLSHTYVHLLYGKIDSQTELQAKDSRFTPQWVNPSETSEVLLPDILDIINQIKLAKSYFFLDLYLTR